jgi:hypothetical protein
MYPWNPAMSQQPAVLTDDEGVELSETAAQVYLWRYKAFRDAGIHIALAEMLADSDADLAALRKLQDAGCPVDTIIAILT